MQSDYNSDIKLPSSIQVANHWIKVEVWDHIEAEAHGNHGEFVPQSLTIRVDITKPLSMVIETFTHELLPAIYWAYNIEDDDDERTVTVMATGLSIPIMLKY